MQDNKKPNDTKPNDTIARKFGSESDVQRLTGIPRADLQADRLGRAKLFPWYRVGKHILYDLTEVEAIIHSSDAVAKSRALRLEILDSFRERLLSQVPSDERVAELLAELDRINKTDMLKGAASAAPEETAS